MPILSATEDGLVTAVIGGPVGDNEARRALKKWAQYPPEDTWGTVGATTVTADEYGNAIDHVTKLTLTSFAVGTIADNAALAFGALMYTFPAGTILVPEMTIVGGLTGAVSVTAQTPEVGIGSAVASGASATLSTTMEDYIDGGATGGIGGDSTAPDIAGTTFYKSALFTNPVIVKTSSGKARTLYLNVAATWADVAAAGAMTFTGVVTFRWRKIS